MSDKKIDAAELEQAVMEYLTEYREDIQEDVEEVTDEITKAARDELKRTSPKSGRRRKNPYYRGWSVKLQKKGRYKYSKVVWNRTNYQLTHLLEFGHLRKDGKGWVSAQPHIRQVEEKYSTKFVDTLSKKIKESSKQ